MPAVAATAAKSPASRNPELIRYINLKLAALGQPTSRSTADPEFLEIAGPLLRNYHQKDQLLGNRLCPADTRVQTFLDTYLREQADYGWTRWRVEDLNGAMVGRAGFRLSDDEQHRVGFAGHPVGGDDLGHCAHSLGKPAVSGLPVLLQRHGDVDLQLEPGLRCIEPGHDAAKDPRLLEAPDAMQGRGGGQADDPRELHVRAIRIALELLEQSYIN